MSQKSSLYFIIESPRMLAHNTSHYSKSFIKNVCVYLTEINEPFTDIDLQSNKNNLITWEKIEKVYKIIRKRK